MRQNPACTTQETTDGCGGETRGSTELPRLDVTAQPGAAKSAEPKRDSLEESSWFDPIAAAESLNFLPLKLSPSGVPSDERDLRRYQALFSALVDRLGRRVGRARAEDAVQELFVRMVRSGLARGGRISFNYLLVCARRLARKLSQREASRAESLRTHHDWLPTSGESAPTQPPEPDAEGESRIFAYLLQGLTRREWEAVWLTVVQGLTVEQAAECMALPATTVRGIRQRALLRVRDRALRASEH